MLGMKTYTKAYIDGCRSKVEADLASYRKLAKAATNPAGSAMAAFEATFFNNMVLVLDEMFVHRLRTVEGKDGNPLNEVRVLCNSMLQNNNIMTADSSIKLSPEKSVLKYQFGDEIALSEADFVALSAAFFDEIKRKFS